MARNSKQMRRNNHRSSVKLVQGPENGLEAFMDASVDAFLLFDENLNLMSINPAGERMFGISKELLEGKSILDFAPQIRKTGRYDKYLDAIKTGEPFFAEEVFPHPRFGDMHLSTKAFKMRKGLGMIVNDISERKRVEEALTRSEKYFRALTENASDAVAVVSGEGVLGYGSPSFERMLGYDRGYLKGKNSFELVHPDDLPKAADLFTQLIQNPSAIVKSEIHFRHSDGSWHTLEVAGRNLLNDPVVAGIVANCRDITEERRMEEALRESELLAITTIEGMSDGVMLVGMDGKVTYVNKAFEKILGHKAEELVGTSALELPTYRCSKDKDKARKALQKVITAGYAAPLDMIAITKDGKEVPISFTASVIKDSQGNPKMLVAVLRDVSEHEEAEEKLRKSEKYFRSLIKNAQDAIVVIGEDVSIVHASPAVERMLGYKPEELIGTDGFSFVNPDDMPLVMKAFAGLGENPDSVVKVELRIRHKDGLWRIVEAAARNLLHDEAVKGIVVNWHDITERKKAEEALRESEAKLKLYLDNSPDAIYILDAMGNFLYGNIAAEKAVGYSREEMLGRNFVELSLLSDEQLLKAAQLHELNLAGKPTGPQEYELTRKDGSRVFVEISTYPVGQGDNLEVIGIARDTTERRKMESELRRLSDAVMMAKDSIVVSDPEGIIIEANEATLKMHGMENRADLVGRSSLELIAPEDREMVTEKVLEAAAAGNRVSIEYHCIANDGRKFLIEASISVMKDGNGEPMGYMAVARDITERKRMEEEVRLLSDAVRMTTDSVAITDMSGRILDINESGLRLYGLSDRADFVGRNPLDAIAPEDRREAIKNMAKIVETGQVRDIEYHVVRKDGSRILIETSVSLIKDPEGKPKGLVAVARDISERRRMEEELAQSEAKYRSLIETAGAGVATIDLKGNFVLVNEALCNMSGYTREELLDKNFADFLYPDDAAGVLDSFSRGLEGKRDILNLEFRLICKEGRVIWCYSSPTPLIKQNETIGFNAIIHDITQRKQAEDALKLSEERYRLVVDNASEGIVVAQDGMLKFFNFRATDVLGYSGEEMASKPSIELVHPDDRQMVVGSYMARLEGKEVPPIDSFRVVDRAGNVRWVEINAVVINWEGRPATLSFLTDITERKKAEEEKQRMEEQLLLAGRLAAVGELSAGVAHELNNPIAAIQGFAQLLAARNDLDETVRNDLGIVYREALRAAKITQNLLSFARRHEPEKHVISLNEVIEKTLELRAHQMKVNNIEVVADLAADLPKTMADFHQMQQVFVNIINNAEQAMVKAHGKGRLVVRTQKVSNMIQISFADDGPGIPEESIKMIFDPFFTTKDVGQGTGLGLSICYGLVEAHGGRIYARSKLGEGATFVVEIPIISEGQ